MDDIEIRRRSIRANYAHGLSNIFPLLRWQIDLLLWMIRFRNEYDIIHACDFDTVLPALICKKLFTKKTVYDIFDFYADHLRATPGWIKRIIRSLDLWVINQVDAVILVDDVRWDQIKGTHPQQVIVLNNSPEDVLDGLVSTKVTNDYALRMAYVGLMQVERGLLEVLEVLQYHPEWRLDLAGFGGDEVKILEAARGFPNVKWHGRISYQAALDLSARADVLFALYDPRIPNHRFASPNKVFEAMMLGKPIIVARGTNVDHIIEQAEAGLVVEYGDTAALEEAFEKLEQDKELYMRLGRNARQAYEKKYSWEVMEKRLLGLYKILLHEQA